MNIYSLSGAWQFRQVGTEEWLAAQVPGGVHTDLLAVGHIPNPFVGDNEKHVQWVAESDWEYQRFFTVTPELVSEDHVFLVCDGLDTLATVTLNGHLLGQTDNMFRQYRWDVKALLHSVDASGRPAANELRMVFASPVKYVAEKQAVRPLPGVSQAIPGGSYLRKAPAIPPVNVLK